MVPTDKARQSMELCRLWTADLWGDRETGPQETLGYPRHPRIRARAREAVERVIPRISRKD